MIGYITILIFFIYLCGLGYTATYFLKKPEPGGERFILYLAIGLGILPILILFLNFLHIALDWKLIFFLSIIFPMYILIKKILAKEFKVPRWKPQLTKSNLILLGLLLIFTFSLFMYTKGAFAYPYLEDEDPWGHAVGAKYVALEKTVYDPIFVHQTKIDEVLSYIDPYPPAYDAIMGILHQTSADLNWTLKFFNALIISLGLLFFYLFAQHFMGHKLKALLATFFLAVIPAYFSHFIWAHSLVVALFFPAIYALFMIKEDKKWFYVAVLIIASIWVTQNIEEPIKLTVMLLLFILIYSVAHKQVLKKELAAIAGGVLLSCMWWGMMIYKYSFQGFIRYFTGDHIFAATESSLDVAVGPSINSVSSGSFFVKFLSILQSFTSSGGSASRAYSFDDFFIAPTENLINSPLGIGVVISMLVLFGVGYALWYYRSSLVEPQQAWLSVTLFWLIYTFWGVNGQTFLVSIVRGPFRMWLLLAIPVALLAAEATFNLISIGKRWKIPAVLVVILVLVGAGATSGHQKYIVNTSLWPTSGAFSSPSEPVEYASWFATIPLNTKVFLYNPQIARDKIVIGLGGDSCVWCEDIIEFRRDIINKDAIELHSFLKRKQYEYLIINPAMDLKLFNSVFGVNLTAQLLPQRYTEIQTSGLFTPVYHQENRFMMLKVN